MAMFVFFKRFTPLLIDMMLSLVVFVFLLVTVLFLLLLFTMLSIFSSSR